MKLPFIILLLAFSMIAAHAEMIDDRTLVRLAHVEIFAFGGIGRAGVITQGEKDYKEILLRPTALADFQKLFQTGNPQAKCYALVGIRAIKSKISMEFPTSVRLDKLEVMTESGCFATHKSLASMLIEIEVGKYDRAISIAGVSPGSVPNNRH